jgi:recombination protein RecR
MAVKDRVKLCSRCFSLTEDDPCLICTDSRRDATLLCAVAEAKDIYALERTSAYRGRYHVLGGVISPMDGIGPAQLRIKELIERIAAEGPHELVIATNPNAEGEATALYLSRLISPSGRSHARQSPRRPPHALAQNLVLYHLATVDRSRALFRVDRR